MLGHARCADVEILRQLFQLRHGGSGRHQPTQAPAGHAEIFGETIEDEGIVVHFQHARCIAAIGQAMVDLVHHQVTATLLEAGRQRRQLILVQQLSCLLYTSRCV